MLSSNSGKISKDNKILIKNLKTEKNSGAAVRKR